MKGATGPGNEGSLGSGEPDDSDTYSLRRTGMVDLNEEQDKEAVSLARIYKGIRLSRDRVPHRRTHLLVESHTWCNTENNQRYDKQSDRQTIIHSHTSADDDHLRNYDLFPLN